jgi:hypothetical protein
MRVTTIFGGLALAVALSACSPDAPKPLNPKPDKKPKAEHRAARPDFDTPEGQLATRFSSITAIALADVRQGRSHYSELPPSALLPNCKKAAELQGAQRMIEITMMHDALVEEGAPGYAGKGTLGLWGQAEHAALYRLKLGADIACATKDRVEFPAVRFGNVSDPDKARASIFRLDEHESVGDTRALVMSGIARMTKTMEELATAEKPFTKTYTCDTARDLGNIWYDYANRETGPSAEIYTDTVWRFTMALEKLCP